MPKAVLGGIVFLIGYGLIDIKGLEKTQKMVEDLGGKAFSFECDVTDGVKVKETVDAAAAALVAALVIGPRRDFKKVQLAPHNVPFTLLGTGLLWFGWFGFNAGSALAANNIAALAFTTTMLAPAGTPAEILLWGDKVPVTLHDQWPPPKG